MLFDAENDTGNDDPKAKLREQIAKGNLPEVEKEIEIEEKEEEEEKEDDEEVEEKEEETEEAKLAREVKEKETAKLQRKQDRMQRRIDEAIAKQKAAEAKAEALEAQLAADPDKTLTAEEIKKQAKVIADEAIAAKELENLNKAFQADCDKLQAGAKKVDKDFDDKITDIAEQFGPIPSFMIGVLSDLDNGADVLAHIANDEDIAEALWKKSPARMTTELVKLSNKLLEEKKPPKKQISKVPDPGERVQGGRSNSTTLTPNDAKDMDVWTRKRMAMMEEKKKVRGF